MLFTDLEGFTAFSEHLGPETVRARLSEHFTAMVEALLAEGATLDKFIGDSVMAYFGAPVPLADHPARACSAALAMQARMAEITARWVAEGLPRVRMRVGINSGRVVAGNMGTATVFNYTVVGDAVNLAARLEGANKTYGTSILVGDATRAAAGPGFVFREIDRVRVHGRDEPVALHELVGRTAEVDARRLDVVRLYAQGLDRYRRQDWPAAVQAFGDARSIDPDDAASGVMWQRSTAHAATPPGPGWNGVHVLGGK